MGQIIDTLIEIINIVMNFSNSTTAVERELLNKTLYYDIRQVQNYS